MMVERGCCLAGVMCVKRWAPEDYGLRMHKPYLRTDYEKTTVTIPLHTEQAANLF